MFLNPDDAVNAEDDMPLSSLVHLSASSAYDSDDDILVPLSASSAFDSDDDIPSVELTQRLMPVGITFTDFVTADTDLIKVFRSQRKTLMIRNEDSNFCID